MLWEDARLGQGLVSDNETAGIADKGSRHPTQSRGSGGLSRTRLEVIGNLGEAEARAKQEGIGNLGEAED